MEPAIIFVTGVNGVGKTSVIPFLSSSLPKSSVHDFDERGVPDNAGREWRESEALYWLGLGQANLAAGVSTIVCGFVKPKEIQMLADRVSTLVNVCVLSATKEVLTKRIQSRYQTALSVEELLRTTGKTVEKFTEDNVYIAGLFEADARELDYALLDTSALSPEQTAVAIVEWLKDYKK